MPWGKGGLPVREDKSILAKPVSVSARPPGFRPCLVSRFLAGSQVRGSLSGQANGTGPLPTPPPSPSPIPKADSPSDSSGATWCRQPGHSFLSSSWGQQLLLSCGAQGTPFPGRSSSGQTREQVVQIRNTSVGDCFKTRLFQASRRTKDVERSAQHHSVDELPARALPSPALFPCPAAASTSASPSIPHPPCLAPVDGNSGWGGRGGKRW